MSVLEKLIRRNEGDLDIPVVMAVDAMMAGIDTTGNTAAFLLYHLAINQDKQENLYAEIVKEIGKENVTEAKLKKMKYLKACQRESQRMIPTASGIGRKAQVEFPLGGYTIPVKTSIIYFACNNLINEDYY